MISERLIKLRKLFKPNSASAFARELGISQTTYSNYENGVRSIPDNVYALLHSKFNANLNWLLTGNGKMLNSTNFTKRKQPKNLSVKEWGQNIQKLRAENNLTIDNFCKLTGIKEKDLIAYINDDKEPTVSDLIKIKNHFNIEIDNLLFNNCDNKDN